MASVQFAAPQPGAHAGSSPRPYSLAPTENIDPAVEAWLRGSSWMWHLSYRGFSKEAVLFSSRLAGEEREEGNSSCLRE